MATAAVCRIIVLLFAICHNADCTLSSPGDLKSCVTEDKSILWNYSDSADISTVVWEFIGSNSSAILILTYNGSNAVVHGGYNVVHISNGAIQIKNSTTANNGKYRITVIYSSSLPIAVDEIMVKVSTPPTGLNYTITPFGEQITVSCFASSLGGPIPANVYIEVDSEIKTGSQSANVTKNKEIVRCCLQGDAANCLDENKRCVSAVSCTTPQPGPFKILCSIGVALMTVCIVFPIVLIIVGRQGNPVIWRLSRCDIAVCALVFVVLLYTLIVGAIGVAKNVECRRCTNSNIDECNTCLGLCGTSIALSCFSVTELIFFIVIRQGWCGERFSCLNRVLPVCKDTEQRGPPDGKPDSHAAKEKRREVTHNEQHNLKETGVHKDKPNKEKHEEPSKGRPLPQPTGSNRDDTGSAGAVSRQDVVLDRRPMPDIPSDRHKRGLSANFNDNRDTPLDDNIHVLHTLPVAKKPKNALDPMNTEGQSKNADDQPKKKKKKKKDRDTSRSDDIEDDIESHGKVLAF